MPLYRKQTGDKSFSIVQRNNATALAEDLGFDKPMISIIHAYALTNRQTYTSTHRLRHIL